MIDIIKIKTSKDYKTWETDLLLYCKMPMSTLNRLKTVDTDLLSAELGRDMLEQLVAHMMKMDHRDIF